MIDGTGSRWYAADPRNPCRAHCGDRQSCLRAGALQHRRQRDGGRGIWYFSADSAQVCPGRKELTLEEAIRKFTALPAKRMRLADRGVLKSGMWAEIVVSDPQRITDKATFNRSEVACSSCSWMASSVD